MKKPKILLGSFAPKLFNPFKLLPKSGLPPKLWKKTCGPLNELSVSELVALFEKSGIVDPIAIEMARRLRSKPYDLGEPERE